MIRYTNQLWPSLEEETAHTIKVDEKVHYWKLTAETAEVEKEVHYWKVTKETTEIEDVLCC